MSIDNIRAVFSVQFFTSTGTITVSTNQAAATFTISGPETHSGAGTSFSQPNAAAGNYTVTYGNLPFFETLSSETKTLVAGGSITFSGNYRPSLLISTNSAPGVFGTQIKSVRSFEGRLATDIQIDNPFQFWLGISRVVSTPPGAAILAGTDNRTTAGLLALCASTPLPRANNCPQPGSGTWTVIFSEPGTLTIDLEMTTPSAVASVLYFLGIDDFVEHLDLIDSLLGVPEFQNAALCFVKHKGAAFPPCMFRALTKLVADPQQLDQVVQILRNGGLDVLAGDVVDIFFARIKIPTNLLQEVADMIWFTQETARAKHVGLARISITATPR